MHYYFGNALLLSSSLFFSTQAWHLRPKRQTTVLKDYDYIIVGSGPGGAPLAARLGLAGQKVLVIEAGDDIAATDWNATVPYFNGRASEDPKMAWNFYVRP
jgi:choline dehydrogenase